MSSLLQRFYPVTFFLSLIFFLHVPFPNVFCRLLTGWTHKINAAFWFFHVACQVNLKLLLLQPTKIVFLFYDIMLNIATIAEFRMTVIVADWLIRHSWDRPLTGMSQSGGVTLAHQTAVPGSFCSTCLMSQLRRHFELNDSISAC